METLKRQLEKVLSEQLASETQLRQTRETLNAQIEKTRQVEANLGQLTSERNAKDK